MGSLKSFPGLIFFTIGFLAAPSIHQAAGQTKDAPSGAHLAVLARVRILRTSSG
jgi:hypothetical protein